MNHTRAIGFLLVIGLSACAAKPVEDRYYSLVLAADDVAASEAAVETGDQLIVGPIRLPAYLSQRGLAMQIGENEIQTANHHFWAEPLDEAITKVLVRDISQLTDAFAVDREVGRWTTDGNCRVRVEFDKFHPTHQSRVVTRGRYWISSSDETVKEEFDTSRTLSVDGYAHAVETLRDSLRTLAERIVETVSARCSGDEA